MSDLNWVPGQHEASLSAIKDVRSDKSDTDWMYVTYASKKGPDSQKVTLGGSGSGGINELKNHLKDDEIAFCLVRVSDKIDDSVTTKFVWINWLGSKVPTMQKARLSVHLGPIKEVFGQVHSDISCNTQDEISHEIVMEKVMSYSGSGSKVLDDQGKTGVKSQVGSSRGAVSSQGKGSKTAELTIDDSVKEAIKSVRRGDTSWCAAGYDSPDSSHLVVLGSGSGGADELAEHLKDNSAVYAIIRKIEQIDNTEAVKFCYIRWVGSQVPRMQKAKLGTQTGDIYTIFTPVHTSLDSPDIHEVNDANIMRLIQNASGTASHILETQGGGSHQQQQQPTKTQQPTQRVNASASQPRNTGGSQVKAAPGKVDSIINFEDEDGIKGAIKAVRKDSSGLNWVLVTYTAEQSKTLKLLGTGSGGLEELKSHMTDKNILYGLYRTTEQIDDSTTVKFCFIDYRGPNIHRMQRANLGTHSGAVKELFHPYHVDLHANREDEISEDTIQEKIKNASGTAHHVLD